MKEPLLASRYSPARVPEKAPPVTFVTISVLSCCATTLSPSFAWNVPPETLTVPFFCTMAAVDPLPEN